MQTELHKNFLRAYIKQPQKIQEKFKEKRNLFIEDMFHPILNNHHLNGEYEGCRSINITGDIRAIFYVRTDGDVVFIKIGSHSELYE
ncbi:MAG: type II toxin-antitoxin system mRNA interferase toxin, RelE/StbE family [Candidatus Magasanikbacteria bacterium]|nr:type II toxin-antitoxin system mRNA interferase toxin, RelE/StbE family [Candidatus Magasanikbacteria bacterium]